MERNELVKRCKELQIQTEYPSLSFDGTPHPSAGMDVEGWLLEAWIEGQEQYDRLHAGEMAKGP